MPGYTRCERGRRVRKLFCIHKWKLSAEKYLASDRVCEKCGKEEHWLPGHGGSEIGCWCPEASGRGKKLTGKNKGNRADEKQ